MAKPWTRAALGAVLLAAGTGLMLAGAMAMRSNDSPVGAPGLRELAATVTTPPDEVAALGKALAEHLPPDAIVLAWQDVSRHLHLSEEASASFGWTDALLAPRDEGIRQLREHAGDSTVHLVVHVRDALLLGAMAPERIGVAFQDQPDAGNLHGSINNARDWVRKEGYKAYSAYRPDTTRLRIVALTDDASAATLIGSLLPFHDPRRQAEPVQGLTLVHQVGGFWVYRVEPDPS
ncbi:MAG: hypothetical protein IH616_14135 [Gemmatimonadales bacterium]|nr:hypothetical protein [Gemmatimonadales bacterium]